MHVDVAVSAGPAQAGLGPRRNSIYQIYHQLRTSGYANIQDALSPCITGSARRIQTDNQIIRDDMMKTSN